MERLAGELLQRVAVRGQHTNLLVHSGYLLSIDLHLITLTAYLEPSLRPTDKTVIAEKCYIDEEPGKHHCRELNKTTVRTTQDSPHSFAQITHFLEGQVNKIANVNAESAICATALNISRQI